MNGCSARPRRRGTVSGFLTAGGDYLEAVRSDLGLSLTPAEFAAACGILRRLGREPTADELYFTAAYINAAKALPSALRIGSVRSDDPSLIQLFRSLDGRFRASLTREVAALPAELTALAVFASGVTESGFTVGISDEAAPAAAVSTQPAAFAAADGFRIAVSRKDAALRTRACPGDLLVLLSPPDGCLADDFSARLSRAASELYRAGYAPSFRPTSGSGLIFDLEAFCGGGHLSAPALPLCGGFAGCSESLCAPFAGCALSAIRPDTAEAILPTIAAHGIGAAVFGTAGGSDFTVASVYEGIPVPETAVRLPAALLKRLRFYLNADIAATSAPLPGSAALDTIACPLSSLRAECGKTAFFPDAELLVSAARAAGDDPVSAVRSAFKTAAEPLILAGAPKGDICFAVCGKLSPRDGSAVPLILGIDAYVRSEAPRTVAADFTPAPTESSRLTVFAFVAARRKAL